MSTAALEKPKVIVVRKNPDTHPATKVAVVSNGSLVHKDCKGGEGSPLLAPAHLADIKSKPAPNGISPLAICQKPEVIHPSHCHLLLILSSSQKPDSLVLGVQKPGVGGCRVQKLTGGNAVSTTREVQTEEKSETWMKEVESSSIPGEDVHRSRDPGCPNTLTSQAAEGPSGGACTSSLPPPCQGSNMKASPCREPASTPSCQQPPECEEAGTRGSVAKSVNGVRGRSEGGTPGRGRERQGHHHQHARRLVINLDDKNKFTEEVTV